jgi:hypothetical protein
MSEANPTDADVREKIEAIFTDALAAAGIEALVIPYWDMSIVTGESLNAARLSDDTTARAVMFSLLTQEHTREGAVPFEPERARAMSYARFCKWAYRLKIVESYTTETDDEGLRSEDRFSRFAAVLVDALGNEPKLRFTSTAIDKHEELQIKQRTIPQYGDEAAHTGDGMLVVDFHQAINSQA